MSKAYTDENLPDKYPVDTDLIRRAEMLGSGHLVHDVNAKLAEYKTAAWAFDRSGGGGRAWFSVVERERLLRGTVAEAESGRIKVVKPLHDF